MTQLPLYPPFIVCTEVQLALQGHLHICRDEKLGITCKRFLKHFDHPETVWSHDAMPGLEFTSYDDMLTAYELMPPSAQALEAAGQQSLL